MNQTLRIILPAALAGLLGSLGCGAVGGADDCQASTQDEALACLGVPQDDSPRVDRTGVALPASYSPLGATKEVGVSEELFMVGMQVAPPTPVGDPQLLDNRALTMALSDDDTHALSTTVLDAQPAGTAWASDTHSGHPSEQTTRAAAAPDLDGDGVNDTVVAYLDFDDPANAGVVFVERVGTDAPQAVATIPDARDIEAVRADVDGDGNDEIAIAVATSTDAQLFVVDVDAAGRFAVVDGSTRTLPRLTTVGSASVELAAGNIDRDNGEEIAAVLNEYDSTQRTGVSTYAIVDDAGASFASLVSGGVLRVIDGGSYEAQVADVAIGDVDADGVGEIVFAGLSELPGVTCTSYRHVYLVLDDAGDSPAPLAPIAQRSDEVRYVPASGCDEVSSELPVSHVFVNTADIDGDGVDEIQANLRVFDDLRAGSLQELHTIDPSVLAGPYGRGGSALSTSTTAITTADINGNGRSEIIVFGQHMDQIVVWGLDGPDPATAVFRQMMSIPTALYNSQTRVFPIILPVNVDHDGAVLKYSDAEHDFVFTQPVILAAIAAAPCAEGIGQNLDACSTAWGTSQTSTGGVDGNVTVSASTFVSFEAKDPFFGLGVEGKESVTTSASFSASRTYSLQESVEYATGPLEDTVVFTTIPLDQYTYTVVAHPDPSMVGTKIVVNVPRKPVTLQVERSFYNSHVADGSFKVDASVFLHTPGELDSYPTEDDADALIATGGLGHIGPLGDLVDALGNPLVEALLGDGLKSQRPITVGQGSGQTSTEIVFTKETGYRAGAEVSYESELAVTGGGAAVGTTIGGSVGAGLSWGTSTSTTYRGTIGSIAGDNLSDNLYSTGLFTYVYNYGNPNAPQFEVVNYWVER